MKLQIYLLFLADFGYSDYVNWTGIFNSIKFIMIEGFVRLPVSSLFGDLRTIVLVK